MIMPNASTSTGAQNWLSVRTARAIEIFKLRLRESAASGKVNSPTTSGKMPRQPKCRRAKMQAWLPARRYRRPNLQATRCFETEEFGLKAQGASLRLCLTIASNAITKVGRSRSARAPYPNVHQIPHSGADLGIELTPQSLLMT